MTYHTITAIRKANKDAGQHWFDPGAMRFFHSRIASPVLGGRYFVTSEKCHDDDARRYTVRMAEDDGSIETVSDFQQFETLTQARMWLWQAVPEMREAK
jgi:hypothetical protein